MKNLKTGFQIMFIVFQVFLYVYFIMASALSFINLDLNYFDITNWDQFGRAFYMVLSLILSIIAVGSTL